MTDLPTDSIGLGLRIPHYRHIFSERPKVDFFEIISENFMSQAPLPRRNLERVLADFPVVLHGVGLGIASAGPLDPGYLNSLKRLADFCDAPFFTDHLCWTQAHGIHHHDLLPFPYTEEIALFLAGKAARVQEFIGRPFGLENLSSYVAFRESEMSEWEFYNQVVELSGCHYLLDINNVYVSSVNHGFDPLDYLSSIRWEKVLQCHIAGHTVKPDGYILDTHEEAVCGDVWDLYREAWKISGGFPTLLERDGKIPPFPELHAEALLAQSYQAAESP